MDNEFIDNYFLKVSIVNHDFLGIYKIRFNLKAKNINNPDFVNKADQFFSVLLNATIYIPPTNSEPYFNETDFEL